MNHDLKQLIRLQTIDLAIQELRTRIDKFPGISKALDEKLRSAQAALESAKEKAKSDQSKRKGLEISISSDLLPRYERVRKARGGIAVAAARNEVCEICQVRIRPQVFQEIRHNDQIITCDACQRILYNPENLDHPFEVA